jgi:hypothetical protein
VFYGVKRFRVVGFPLQKVELRTDAYSFTVDCHAGITRGIFGENKAGDMNNALITAIDAACRFFGRCELLEDEQNMTKHDEWKLNPPEDPDNPQNTVKTQEEKEADEIRKVEFQCLT